MLTLDRWVGPLRDHLVFFADGAGVAELARACRPYDLYRIRHALDVPGSQPAVRLRESVTSVIALGQEQDSILGGMDAKSCRYEVRRAEKLGDRLALRRNDRDARQDFRRLLAGLIEHTHHVRPPSRRRYAQYGAVSDVVVAYVDGAPVAGHLVVRDPAAGRARLVFSASVRHEPGPLRALSGPVNRWLHWQELLFYREEGYRAYDFGGVNPQSSIGRFKLSFGGELERGTNVVLAGALAVGPLALLDAAGRTSRGLRRGRASS
ncbi:MAG TPA: GNAT family N-acetyltransferase [Gaiellaceae bacterium]|nr:GNAT family N-acetyltransferase [Gaiellaceae bacterium]